jgi:hypothetical protein
MLKRHVARAVVCITALNMFTGCHPDQSASGPFQSLANRLLTKTDCISLIIDRLPFQFTLTLSAEGKILRNSGLTAKQARVALEALEAME